MEGAEAGLEEVEVAEPFDESELELSLLVSDFVSLLVGEELSDEPLPSVFFAAPLGDA